MIKSLFYLLYVFFKTGLFSFGGGYAMLPLIYKELEQFHMSEAEFFNVVALSNMTPGPIAVNAATYVGFQTEGFWGALFATVGVSLPSFILILIISAFFYKFKSNKYVEAVLSGIRPATVGMIASAVIMLAETSVFKDSLKNIFAKIASDITTLGDPLSFISIGSIVIFVATIILNKKFKVGPITLTLAAGVIGAFIA